MIVGVDVCQKLQIGKNYKLDYGNASHLNFPDNTFDNIYSLSTFEHINDIPTTLSEIKRVLKPRGKFIVKFAPLWTSVCGHHCYSWSPIFPKGSHLDRWEKVIYGIPAWGHLYMSKEEMIDCLKEQSFEEYQINEIVKFIYDSDVINRCSYTQMKDYIFSCGMIIRQYKENLSFSRNWGLDCFGETELTSDIINKVEEAGYNKYDLGVTGIEFIMEKYESVN